MKIYEFFKIPEDESEVSRNKPLEERYQLYAITNKKELAERFQKDRNMKKFLLHVHKNVTKEEYIDFCNENRSCVLEIHPLITCMSNVRVRSNMEEREVLMTYFEWQCCQDCNSILDNEAFWHYMPFPYIFSKEVQETLEFFNYKTYYRLIMYLYLDDVYRDIIHEDSDNDDYSAPDMMMDEVAILMDIVIKEDNK